MTTDTETLREQFEVTLASIFGSRPLALDRRSESGAYADEAIQMAWLACRASHAAAKAETAAGVAAERERATDVLAACIPEWDGQEAVDGGDLIRMLIGAIRAGAKERDE